MSGIKERPELSGLSIKNKHKFKRRPTKAPEDPIDDCKLAIYYVICDIILYFSLQ